MCYTDNKLHNIGHGCLKSILKQKKRDKKDIDANAKL